MSGIKYILQKDLFDEEDTKILCVLSVCKSHARKSHEILVLSNSNTTNCHSILHSITQVKVQEKGVYKKKRSWQLDELKIVDGHGSDHEFELVFDRKFEWNAITLNEKKSFLSMLWRVINKSVVITNKALFRNIPESWMDDSTPMLSVTKEAGRESPEDENETVNEFDDFKELAELEKMLEGNSYNLVGEYTSAIRNADLFIDHLSKNLIELDGANVESILASKAEEKVLSLMQQIDSAIDEVETVEKALDEYEEIMCNIRDSMEKMGEKNTMIEIANKNNIKLLQELDKIISQLDLSHAHQLALTDTDLTSLRGLQAAKDAGRALQNAMGCDIDPALLRLGAVQDQRKRFEKWKAKFSSTISRHLNNLFIHLGNDLGETQSSHRDDLKLPKHHHHRELGAYQELMHWMKAMDPNAYDALTKVYTSSLSKVYDRDIRNFFDQSKHLISKNHVHDEMNTSISGKSKIQPKASLYGILGLPKDQWSSTAVDANERQRFDSVLEKVLTELEPIALNEQMFCINFFQLAVVSPTSSSKNPPNLAITPNKDTSIIIPQKRLDRLINEEVRRMMSELFGILESELVSFIVNFEKLDTL
jgi:exocyst complex component 1